MGVKKILKQKIKLSILIILSIFIISNYFTVVIPSLADNDEIVDENIGNLADDVTIMFYNPSNTSYENYSTFEADFQIVPTYQNSVGNSERLVIQHAVDEWNNILLKIPGSIALNFDITFAYEDMPGNTLGSTTPWIDPASGKCLRADISFDTSGTIWYVDNNPSTDDEFDDTPPSGYDLLTVARHEIAHAVGWVVSSAINNLVVGNTFDSNRMNIALDLSNNQIHTDETVHIDDLMNPELDLSVRKEISLYPTVSFLARTFGYTVSMRVVDGDAPSGGDGSAVTPWRTVRDAFQNTPNGIPILIIPDTYIEVDPTVRSTSTEILIARGGDVVIASQNFEWEDIPYGGFGLGFTVQTFTKAVNWNVKVEGLVFIGNDVSGTIPPNSMEKIQIHPIGFGPVTITVTVGNIQKTYSAFLLIALTINLEEIEL